MECKCRHTDHVERHTRSKTHDSFDNHVGEEVLVVSDELGAHGSGGTFLQELTLFPRGNKTVIPVLGCFYLGQEIIALTETVKLRFCLLGIVFLHGNFDLLDFLESLWK